MIKKHGPGWRVCGFVFLWVAMPALGKEAPHPLAPPADIIPVPVLGQVISREVELNGLRVPSGTTLLNRSLLRTDTYPAIIHLDTGDVLELATNSSVYFEKVPSGKIRVSVFSGTVSYFSGSELKTVPSQSILLFPEREKERIAAGGPASREGAPAGPAGSSVGAYSEGPRRRTGLPRSPEAEWQTATGEAGGGQMGKVQARAAGPAGPAGTVGQPAPATIANSATASARAAAASAAVVAAVREEAPASPVKPPG